MLRVSFRKEEEEEPVTEGGREFHRVTTCGAKEHMKYVVFELYGRSWIGL